MKYKSVVATQIGGPDVLRIVEKDLRPPVENEARIRVLATPVCQDDIAVRAGKRPFIPKTPFVPGYSCIGEVDAVGTDVTEVAVGDRMAAFTNYGSHAEYVYWPAEQLVQVPETTDLAAASTLILNYLVAYQILNRVVQAKTGETAVIIGASGGVGTAFLQLGRLKGLHMYGLASASKHQVITENGGIPIDYRTQDFVEVVKQSEPDGIDYVFNGMGEEYFERSLAVLRRGGVLVHYGGPQSFTRFLLLVVKLIGYNLLPNGKKIIGYGTHREDVEQFKQDWTEMLRLMDEGKIRPVIDKKYALMDVLQAYEHLDSGTVTGNLVLLAPELL